MITKRSRSLAPIFNSGSIGVALFLAAFARIADDRPSRELALAAIASVMRIHGGAGANPAALARMPIGGGFGIASVIYGLVQLAALLDRPDLLDHAIALGHEISAERIAADRAQDLLSGAGGAILGLLTLHGVRPDHGMLQRAIWCGQHIMTARPAHDSAFALARLWEVSGQPRFRGRRARGLERRIASGADQRRRASVPWTGRPRHRRDRAAAIRNRGRAPARPRSRPGHGGRRRTSCDASLCCGRSGGIELLIEAGRYLRRPDLMTWPGKPPQRICCPSAVRMTSAFGRVCSVGLSGIGYSLLRTVHPELLPCPLLWDGPPGFSWRETPAS